MIPLLAQDPASPFPPIEQAMEYPNGLLACGGDLAPQRLINAYRHGVFPWYSEGQPILWWSPAPRCVLYPERVHLSRSLVRRYNQGTFRLTADLAFERVINECAKPRKDEEETWITNDMQAAYVRLHELGVAHSVEVWLDDVLAGGIYGLALGAVFFGESMFSRETDASKVALTALCKQLQQWKFTLIDCQVSNPHLVRMGAVEIPLDVFKAHLQDARQASRWGRAFSCDQRW